MWKKRLNPALGTDSVPKLVPKSEAQMNPPEPQEASGMKRAADASRTNGSDVLSL